MPETGRLQPTDVVVLAGSIRVGDVKAQLAATATSEVLTYSGTGKLVTVTIEESQRAYAKPESKVKVDVPGAGEAVATVREVAVSGESGQPKLTVTIALDDVGMAEKGEAGSVRVRFDGARRAGVLAVPVQALLALREGGYAVEVRHETGTRLIDVELGMFAGGLVEVSGPELAEGMQVVVAA